MSPCDEYSVKVLRLLDGDFQSHELDDFRNHLKDCADCRARLEAEQALSKLLRRPQPLDPAPDVIRSRVSAAVMQHLESNPARESCPHDQNKIDPSTPETKEVVLGLGKALNDENYEAARRYVSDSMKYVGPFGSRDGAEAYLREIERLHLKFDIQKIFADNQDVCVLYDITASGITLFACALFQVEAGRVRSMRVIFDPRPLLGRTDPVK